MTKQEIKQGFLKLSNDNAFPDALSKRRRGRAFEKLIYQLLKHEGLQPRTSFRPEGEEIDGSFILGHSVYLLEAKWHKSEMPASSIYQFKGKVDGKLVGTIGVYISMSGFSSEAIDALTFGKSINIILFDKEDFTTCINEENGFTNVLLMKLRIASEKGTVFFKVKSLSVSSILTNKKSKVSITQSNISNFLTSNEDITQKLIDQLVFIVEGVSDQRIIASLAERIFTVANKRREINILVAGGKYSVAKLANVIQNNVTKKSNIVLVADSDYNAEETLTLLLQSLDSKGITTIIPDPSIEVWFADLNIRNRKELMNKTAQNKMESEAFINSLVLNLDIEKLRKNNNSFNKLFEVLTK
jgi:hypothetical protein